MGVDTEKGEVGSEQGLVLFKQQGGGGDGSSVVECRVTMGDTMMKGGQSAHRAKGVQLSYSSVWGRYSGFFKSSKANLKFESILSRDSMTRGNSL